MTPYMAMFSAMDITLILIVVLLLFGAKKLPELARSLGQSLSEFKKGKGEADKPEAPDDANKPPPPKAT
jgi:sec-independent protein translocase protein TatA